MERNSDKLGAPSVTPAMWEQRRYEIAKVMLPVLYERVIYTLSGSCASGERMQKVAAAGAIEYADALIDELKKTQQ